MDFSGAHFHSNVAPSLRRGSTLIEVLAGLVVLGTLLVAVSMARARFMRQWADADKRLEATRAADAMLAGWLATPSATVPIDANGPLGGVPNYVWRTSLIRDPDATRINAYIVRMDVYDMAGSRKKAVFSVDFLRHDYPKIKPAAPPPAKKVPGGKTP